MTSRSETKCTLFHVSASLASPVSLSSCLTDLQRRTRQVQFGRPSFVDHRQCTAPRRSVFGRTRDWRPGRTKTTKSRPGRGLQKGDHLEPQPGAPNAHHLQRKLVLQHRFQFPGYFESPEPLSRYFEAKRISLTFGLSQLRGFNGNYRIESPESC